MKASAFRWLFLPLILAATLGFSACALVQSLRERLSILSVDFGFDRLDVSGLAYPRNTLEVARDLAGFSAGARSKYGVDVRCRIRAKNPNGHAAAFDGAAARLRIRDTDASAPATQAIVPAFRVGAKGETSLDLVFPIRLNNPVFSKAVWLQVLRGESISYRVDADLAFRLMDESAPAALKSLGSGSLHLDVAKGSVDARETASTALDLLLRCLSLVF